MRPEVGVGGEGDAHTDLGSRQGHARLGERRVSGTRTWASGHSVFSKWTAAPLTVIESVRLPW